jgi:signal transduction histidine kinase
MDKAGVIAESAGVTERSKPTSSLSPTLDGGGAMAGGPAAELARIEQADRRRLAAKVHNELQQFVAAARMQVAMAIRHPQASGLGADEVLHLLDQCVEASRALTLDLFPRTLQSAAFPAAIEWLVKAVQARFAVRIQTELANSADPPSHVAFAAFRAAHEALLNVAQHAGVREARVVLEPAGNDAVRITVADAGAGFDAATLENRDRESSALRIARDRVRALGGDVEIRTAPGAGASIVITVPVCSS